MSDISLHFGPLDYAVIALIFGSPGLAVGSVLGALLWRGHRFAGAAFGAVLGMAAWLAGLFYFRDIL